MKSKATPPPLGWFVKLRLQVIGWELENAPFYKKKKKYHSDSSSELFIPYSVGGHQVDSPSKKKLTALNHLVGNTWNIPQFINSSQLRLLCDTFDLKWRSRNLHPLKAGSLLIENTPSSGRTIGRTWSTYFSSWWFQPLWKIWVKLGIFPK